MKDTGIVLVVDDEPDIRSLLCEYITALGHAAEQAEDGAVALDMIKDGDFDAVVSDLMMPNLSGMQLLEQLRSSEIFVPFIFVTGVPTKDATIKALRLGAFDFIEKPFDGSAIQKVVTEAVATSLQKKKHRGSIDSSLADVSDDNKAAAREVLNMGAARDHIPSEKAEDWGRAKITEMFIEEASSQLKFCIGAIKGLADPESRVFELGYLFRVMQTIKNAANAVGADDVHKLADAAEKVYATFRVSPHLVTKEKITCLEDVNLQLTNMVDNYEQSAQTKGLTDELISKLTGMIKTSDNSAA